CAGAGPAPRVEGDRLGRRPRPGGDCGRVPAVLRADRGPGRGVRVARDVPRAAARAPLWRDLPRRALRRVGVRWARADPRGRRARHGRRGRRPRPPAGRVADIVKAIEIRRARRDDVPFLLDLITHDDVRPYLGGLTPATAEEALAEI